MTSYIIRRLLLTVFTIFIVLTLVFLLIRVAPGDPAVAALGDYASQEAVQAYRERMGLNKPLYIQFFDYISGVFQGDLGFSILTGQSVSSQVASALPHTIELTFAGNLIGVLFGVPLGVLAAIKRNTLADYVSRTLSLAGLSVPAFYLGLLLILLFSVQLNMFPSVGAGSFSNPVANLRSLFLPALTLGLIMTAFIARVSRSSMLNVLREDYIKTARSKGLSETAVLFAHALRNALIPIVTIVGIYVIVLIGSSVMTEIVFSRPGLGKLLVGAMKNRDYVTLQSIMAIYAGFVVIINLIVDLIYGYIDPRVTYE